ncbi:MAG TPA: glycosyltransferase family 2 protein [Chlamydiales bacterium]|nr:glycosyltransferase family 2 protein [Chlamydiales bacterium]
MMKPLLELSIVIPVYNEAENIELTLSKLIETLTCFYEILIVYDFDEDTTISVVGPLTLKFPQIKLLKNTISRGPSGAIRSGFISAQGEKVLVLMADLCDDITQIPKLLSLLPAEADIVSPSRYCRGGGQIIHTASFLKVWLPKIANLLLKHLIGMPSSDSTNSFKIYSSELVKSLKLRSTVSFSVTLEIIVKAYCLGYRIREIPTVWQDRQVGKSNFKLIRSLFVYLPWLLLAFFHSRVIRLPKKWWQKRFEYQNLYEL